MAPKAQTDAETTKVIGKHTRDRSGDTPDAQRARKDNDATMPDVPSLPTGSSGSDQQPTTADIMASLAAMQSAMSGMETRITQTIKGEVTKQVETVTKDLTKVKTTVDTLASDVTSMKKRIDDLENAKPGGGTANGGPRKEEILDVVVKGFTEKKSKEALIAEIETMVKTVLGDAHGVNIDVPTDPCNHGVLTFANNDDKLKFYKQVKEQKDKLDADISFANKLSWPDRVIEKKLGYIKHHLMLHFNKPVSDIKINWRRRFVEMGGKKVAYYDAGTWVFHKSAKVIETKVNEAMEKWTSERETTDPPSESE